MVSSCRRSVLRSRISAFGENVPRGFTLIELVIVVLIVAILAAVAIPSYRKYMIRSHRSAVESFMMELANAQERYMVDNRSYAGDLTALGYPVSAYPPDVADNYSLATSSDSGAPPGFTITATPKPGSGQASDTECGTLSLTSGGDKQASTSSSACWK